MSHGVLLLGLFGPQFWTPEALQTIMASWFAADFGARFVITEEGGKDFIQCPGSAQDHQPKSADVGEKP